MMKKVCHVGLDNTSDKSGGFYMFLSSYFNCEF